MSSIWRKVEGTSRGPHDRPVSDEKLVLQEHAQDRKAVAHRGLSNSKPSRRPSNAAFFHQGIKCDEQIQIKRAQIEMIDGAHQLG
jgi:hypothetical protein